jgi:predicted RNase H-like HicB family nuclease
LELGSVFLEDGFVVVFPELLGGVFAGDAGEDLFAS